MKNLLFILLALALTGVYGQEIELAVGIDSIAYNSSVQFHNGRYMEPLSLNSDTSKGKKRNLYYKFGNNEWAKINRKSKKDLRKMLSSNYESSRRFGIYEKKRNCSKLLLVGTIFASGIIYFAPGGRLLVFASLGIGTKLSYDKSKEAQKHLIGSVNYYNKRLNDHIPSKQSVIAHH